MHHDPGPAFRTPHRPGARFILANAWDAGAAQMLAGMQDLAEICAVTQKPLNALTAGPFTAISRDAFASIGIGRISLGSSLARATHRLIRDAASAMFDRGDFVALGRDVPGNEVAAIMARGTGRNKAGAG